MFFITGNWFNCLNRANSYAFMTAGAFIMYKNRSFFDFFQESDPSHNKLKCNVITMGYGDFLKSFLMITLISGPS